MASGAPHRRRKNSSMALQQAPRGLTPTDVSGGRSSGETFDFPEQRSKTHLVMALQQSTQHPHFCRRWCGSRQQIRSSFQHITETASRQQIISNKEGASSTNTNQGCGIPADVSWATRYTICICICIFYFFWKAPRTRTHTSTWGPYIESDRDRPASCAYG